jgi:hypothetical protein
MLSVLLSVIWTGKSICPTFLGGEPHMNHGLEALIIPLFPMLRYKFFSWLIIFFKNAFQLQLYSSDGNNYMLKEDVIGHNTSSRYSSQLY